MNITTNKSGFTLIEIIVVLIIVGILAAVALPNLFQNVNTGRGSSALQVADAMKSPIEACASKNNTIPSVAPCDFTTLFGASATSVDVNGSGNATEVEVTGASGNPSANSLTYDLVGYDNASKPMFSLVRATSGIFTCTPGATPYQNVC